MQLNAARAAGEPGHLAGSAATPEAGTDVDPIGAARACPGQALLLAALALPGLAPQPARAEIAPEEGVIAARYVDYRDWQSGESRMHVRSPSFHLLLPLGEDYAAEAFYTTDSMSGASPLYHDTLSGASGRGVRDFRRAGDVKLTRYFERGALAVGASVSSERDYLSRAGRVEARLSTADQNTTLALGFGGSADRIDSENEVAKGERRNTLDYLVGVTRVLAPELLAQANLTYTRGHGYYADPYKPLDTRPSTRGQTALLLRVNRWIEPLAAALRTSYRYYRDTWGVRAHTVEVTWEQTLPLGWSLSPGLRYYTQSAADFYRDPPFGAGYEPGALYSADQRLSAFGAVSASLGVVKLLPEGWAIDARIDLYRQRQAWCIGSCSVELKPFTARSLALGVRKTF